MNIKFLPGSLGHGARLVTANGEVLAEFGKDNEFVQTELYSSPGLPLRVKITLDMVVGNTTTIIDADEMPVRALPEAPRALPAPRAALADPEHTEYLLDQLREPFFYNDAFEEDEDEWENED